MLEAVRRNLPGRKGKDEDFRIYACVARVFVAANGMTIGGGAHDGITWLKTGVQGYGSSRQRVIEILEFLAAGRQNASLPHWHKDGEVAGILAGALRNRQDNV